MPEVAGVSQLSYAVLAAADPTHWLRLADMLGAEVSTVEGARRLRVEQERAYRIVLEDGDEDGLVAIGWDAPSRAVFDDLVERLELAGAKPTAAPSLCAARGVEEIITFRDPDGRTNELSWGMASSAAERFHSPRGTGFNSNHTGFGHVTVATDKYAEVRDFYMQVLGMKLTDTFNADGRRLAFLRCNSRHHSLALADRPSAPPRFLHVMLDVASLDDLGVIRDRVIDAGYPIVRDLGRHSTDGVVSFYMEVETPYQVEIGWGTYDFAAEDWQAQRFARDTQAWGHRPLAAHGKG